MDDQPVMEVITPVVAAPSLAEQEASLKILRSDYRMASVSQFINTLKHHISLEFEIEDLEDDLIGLRRLCIIPALFGKLLNTLANDRNVNSSNWRTALRRAYARRNGGINPFLLETQVLVVPDAAEESKPIIEATPVHENGVVTNGAVKPELEEEMKDIIPVETTSEEVKTNGATIVKVDVVEGAAAVEAEDVKMAEASTDEVDLEPKFTTVTTEVEWEDVSLETKIAAVYAVCEWHMTEPERFRKILKNDDELIWRLESCGNDANGNNYYVLADTRLWIQKVLPPSAGLTAARIASDRAWKISEAKRNVKKQSTEVLPKKRDSAARGPPKERNLNSPSKGKGKKRERDDSEEEIDEIESDDDEDESFSSKPKAAKAKAKAKATQEKKKSRNSRGGRAEVWEQVPEEWLEEEGERGSKEDSVGASSVLTSVGDEEEESKGMEVDTQDGITWQEEHRREREILDAKGFVEWEAVCITLEEWEAFPATLAGSKNREEKKFRDYVLDEVIPWVVNDYKERELAKLAAIEIAHKKSLKQVAILESQKEEDSRLLRDRSATSSRLSRASRHQVNGEGSPAASSKGGLESRDDRIKKRADEKLAREMRAEEGVVEESRAMARGEYVDGDTVVKDEYKEDTNEDSEKEAEPLEEQEYVEEVEEAEEIDDQELERIEEEKLAIKEKKRIEREEAKIKREEIAKAKKTAKAQPKVKSKPVYLEEEEESLEEPWYLDCEVCQIAGWNQDDGSSVICCDRCLDWQHLECHQENDKAQARIVDYDDDNFEFICIKCVADPSRRKQERIVPEYSKPNQAGDEEGYEDGDDEDRLPPARAPTKPRPSRTAPTPPAPKPKPAPKPAPKQPPTTLPKRSTASTQAAPAATANAHTPMDYESLLAMVTRDNGIMLQLPRAYQVHFAEKLGIPLPPDTTA